MMFVLTWVLLVSCEVQGLYEITDESTFSAILSSVMSTIACKPVTMACSFDTDMWSPSFCFQPIEIAFPNKPYIVFLSLIALIT